MLVKSYLQNRIQFDRRPPRIELFKTSTYSIDKTEYKHRINQLENTFVNSEVYMLTNKVLVIYTEILINEKNDYLTDYII